MIGAPQRISTPFGKTSVGPRSDIAFFLIGSLFFVILAPRRESGLSADSLGGEPSDPDPRPDARRPVAIPPRGAVVDPIETDRVLTANTKLISVDDHVIEPLGVFVDHIAPRYRDRAPRIVEPSPGVQGWDWENRFYPR